MKSILIIGAKNPPETFLSRLFNGLSENNFQVILGLNKKPDKDWFSKRSNSWIWLPSWNVSKVRRFINILILLLSPSTWNFSELKLIFSIARKKNNLKTKFHQVYLLLPLINKRIDVVYFPWILSAINYIDFFNALKIPVVVSLRGSMINVDPFVQPEGEEIRKNLKNIFLKIQKVHCVSHDILNTAIQLGLNPEKASVIRPAVDPDFFYPLEDKDHQRLKIITTGSLIWRKGYEYALMTIRNLLEQKIDCEFHIVGDGPEKQRILYTIRDLDLESHVVLHGKQSPEQVRDYLQKSDIFILSSLSEGISNAVLEAMACGLPVVTSDCGGMHEAISDGVEGFVVPLRDPLAAAEKIQILASDEILRKKMGFNARQKAINELALDKQIDQFSQLLIN